MRVNLNRHARPWVVAGLTLVAAWAPGGCCLEGSEHGQDPDKCSGGGHVTTVQHAPLAVTPGALLIARYDGGDEGWDALALADDGAPIGEPSPTGLSSIQPRVQAWPGPASALVTATGADAEVYLQTPDGLRAVTRLDGAMAVAAAFDGARYWLVDATAVAAGPLVLVEVELDGSVHRTTVPAPFVPDDHHVGLQLAAAAPGDLVAVWRVNPQLRTDALEFRAMHYVDGQPVGAPWTVAGPVGTTCPTADHVLLATADGYHLITRRGPCDASQPPHMIDVQIDPAAATATERAMPFDPARFPSWVASPRGTLAYDEQHAWMLAADGTAQLLWSAGEGDRLRAAGVTTTGFAGAVTRLEQGLPVFDLVWGAPPAPQRAFVTGDYTYTDDGCQVGRSPTPLLAVVAWLALGRRRRR